MKKVLTGLILLFAWLTVFVSVTPSVQAADITIDYANVTDNGPQYYGVEYTWLDQHNKTYLERYRELNGNLVRVQIHQDFFEQVNDNDDPNDSEINFSSPIPWDVEMGKTMTYGEMFKSLAAEFPDMRFVVTMATCAKWNAADPNGYMGLGGKFPPLDYAEHREFVRELARFLVNEAGIPPEQLFFSFVNEPDTYSHFKGNQSDLVQMAEETRIALDQVSPLIQLGALEELKGTSLTSEFYPQRPAGCCDIWTYHVYNTGLLSMSSALQQRASNLSQYGPVWVTEFADRTYGSPDGEMDFSSQGAALEFAALLGRVWTEVDGMTHFRLADSYLDNPNLSLSGWIGHGLFADHRGTHADGVPHKRFPSYWVFANHYKYLGGAEILNSQESLSDFEIISGKKSKQVNIFVVNGEFPKSNLAFQINNLPWSSATVKVFDNLQSNTPIDSFSISGNSFSYNIPGYSSLLFSIESSSCTGTCKTNSCDTYDDCWSASGECPSGHCCSGTCTTPSTSLIALYHFDEGSGTIAGDSSGYGNDGTVYGAVWTKGISGNALEFDGSDYINVPDSSSLNNPSAVTVEAWVKLDSYMSAQDMCSIVQKYAWSTPGRGGFSLGTANAAGGYSDDGLPAFIIVEDENYDLAVSSAHLSLDTWYHLVGTYDETTNIIRIYVDGKEKDTTSFAGELYSAGVSLEIGRDLPVSRWFDGTIDEIRIYNRALSPEEILEHYNEVKADLNNDGYVNMFDLTFISIHFGETVSHQNWNATADVVENNEIDVFDMVFVASRFT